MGKWYLIKMVMKPILACLFALLSSEVYAEPYSIANDPVFADLSEPPAANENIKIERPAYSYSSEEFHKMADAYVRIIRRNKTMDIDVVDMMLAAEFKGYIAALLDEMQDDMTSGELKDKIILCAQKNTVSDISARTALLIAKLSLNRNDITPISARIAIHFSCDSE